MNFNFEANYPFNYPTSDWMERSISVDERAYERKSDLYRLLEQSLLEWIPPSIWYTWYIPKHQLSLVHNKKYIVL